MAASQQSDHGKLTFVNLSEVNKIKRHLDILTIYNLIFQFLYSTVSAAQVAATFGTF